MLSLDIGVDYSRAFNLGIPMELLPIYPLVWRLYDLHKNIEIVDKDA